MSSNHKHNISLTKNELKNIIARLERENEALKKRKEEVEIQINECDRTIRAILTLLRPLSRVQ